MKHPSFASRSIWASDDVRPGRKDEKWLNAPIDLRDLKTAAPLTVYLHGLPFLYRLIAGIPVASENLLAPPQRDRGGRRYVRVFLGIGNVVADLVMDEGPRRHPSGERP